MVREPMIMDALTDFIIGRLKKLDDMFKGYFH